MATRTISNAGGNYNVVGTWVEGIVPTSADDVVDTATSGQLTVNVASVAKSIILTSSATILTMNAQLTVSGAVTLAAGMTVAGTGNMIVNTTATLTSNGVLWTGSLQFSGANQIHTLADDWTINGTWTRASGASGTINGNNIYIKGGINNTAALSDGTTVLQMIGTGTLGSTSGRIAHSIIINTAGTITFASTIGYGGGTITYTAGTVITTGSTLALSAVNTTLNLAGMTLNNVTSNSMAQLTINSLLTISGTLALGVANIVFAGTSGFTCGVFSASIGNIVFASGVTYTINNTISIVGTAADKCAITASSPPTKAILTLTPGCTMDIGFADITNIDSSLGRMGFTYRGVITTSNNWRILPVVPPTLTS